MRRTPLLACATLSLALFTASFVGCKTNLAPGGAYNPSVTNASGVVTSNPDIALYNADLAFKTAYDSLNLVFQTEYNNRQYFWNISPAVKHTLDKIRPDAEKAVNDYAAARTAYLFNPPLVGLTGVNAVLAKMQQLLLAANAAVAQASQPLTNAPPVPPTPLVTPNTPGLPPLRTN